MSNLSTYYPTPIIVGTSTGTVAAGDHTHDASGVVSGVFANSRINWAAPSAIGGTTASTGAFTSLSATGLSLSSGILTASAPFSFAQTWNASGVTFTGLKFNVTDTASASGSLLMDLQVGGVSRFNVRKDGRLTAGDISLNGTATIQNASTISVNTAFNLTGATNPINFFDGSGNIDLVIRRDAAQTLAQRNGANAQEFRIYNTYTSSTNYERGFFKWDSNVLKIGTEKGSGGGTARDIELNSAGGYVNLKSGANYATVYGATFIAETGAFQLGLKGRWNSSGLFDFGTTVEFRWSSAATWGGSADVGLTRSAAGVLKVTNGSTGDGGLTCGTLGASGISKFGSATDYAQFAADGTLTLNGAANFGGMLKFGGTTSSFPALKRSSAALQVRLADDSAFTTLEAGNITSNGTLSATTEITTPKLTVTPPTTGASFVVNGKNSTGGGQIPSVVLKGFMFLGSESGDKGMILERQTSFGGAANPMCFTGCNYDVTQYNDIMFTSGYYAQFYLKNGGNVGIMTDDPMSALDIDGTSIRIRQSSAPVSATDTGEAGTISWDSNYLYVCVDTNTWKRTVLASW